MKAPVDAAVMLPPAAVAHELGVSAEEVELVIRAARLPGRPLGRHIRLYPVGAVYNAIMRQAREGGIK